MNASGREFEYRCPKCGGSALGDIPRRVSLPKMAPDQVREALGGFQHEIEISEWEDGKGCNVVVFPEVLKAHTRALAGSHGPSPMVLFCSECHVRSEFIGGESPERYWTISTRHGTVWAWHREHLVAIRDYIQLERRPQGFIKLPGWILSGKNRDELVKLIDRALEHGPSKI
jgi:hypothetical protein